MPCPSPELQTADAVDVKGVVVELALDDDVVVFALVGMGGLRLNDELVVVEEVRVADVVLPVLVVLPLVVDAVLVAFVVLLLVVALVLEAELVAEPKDGIAEHVDTLRPFENFEYPSPLRAGGVPELGSIPTYALKL